MDFNDVCTSKTSRFTLDSVIPSVFINSDPFCRGPRFASPLPMFYRTFSALISLPKIISETKGPGYYYQLVEEYYFTIFFPL